MDGAALEDAAAGAPLFVGGPGEGQGVGEIGAVALRAAGAAFVDATPSVAAEAVEDAGELPHEGVEVGEVGGKEQVVLLQGAGEAAVELGGAIGVVVAVVGGGAEVDREGIEALLAQAVVTPPPRPVSSRATARSGRASKASMTRPAVSMRERPWNSCWRTRRPSSIQVKAVASSPKRAMSMPRAARGGVGGSAVA